MRLRALAGALLVAGAALAIVVPLARDESGGAAEEPLLPDAPAPAFTVAEPRPLDEPVPEARWSAVLQQVAVRSQPSPDASIEAMLATRTPEGTQNLVVVQGRAVDGDGSLWIRVEGPGLPGEAVGWVPRAALGPYHAVETRLVVDVEEYTATLLRS